MTGTAHVAGAVAVSAIVLPGAGLRARPGLREARPALERRRAARRVHRRHLRPARSSRSSRGIGEAGKSTVYVRKRNPRSTRRARRPVQRSYIAISTRCMHLGCPVRFVEAAGASSARATAASTTSRARSTAGRRSARSTASTRACATAASRSARATRVNGELKRFSPRDPGEPLDGVGQYLYPSRPDVRNGPEPVAMPKLKLPVPDALRPTPKRPARGQRRPDRAAGRRPRRPASPPSTGSTSARRCPAAPAG